MTLEDKIEMTGIPKNMTLQDYIDCEEIFNQLSVDLHGVPGQEFKCGFSTGIAVLLSDIKRTHKIEV